MAVAARVVALVVRRAVPLRIAVRIVQTVGCGEGQSSRHDHGRLLQLCDPQTSRCTSSAATECSSCPSAICESLAALVDERVRLPARGRRRADDLHHAHRRRPPPPAAAAASARRCSATRRSSRSSTSAIAARDGRRVARHELDRAQRRRISRLLRREASRAPSRSAARSRGSGRADWRARSARGRLLALHRLLQRREHAVRVAENRVHLRGAASTSHRRAPTPSSAVSSSVLRLGALRFSAAMYALSM